MKYYDYKKGLHTRRVQIMMAEKGIELPIEYYDISKGEHRSEEFKKINPECTLPVLVLDDGTKLIQLAGIIKCLEEYFPETPMLGSNRLERILIQEWMHRIYFEVLMSISDILRNKRDFFKDRGLPGPLKLKQIPELVERGSKRLAHFIQMLDDHLKDKTYIVADEFSMADIDAFCGIDLAIWIDNTLLDDSENIRRWHQGITERDSVKKCPRRI